ncbi:MAG: LytTR family DNA-binding domain-containing protein [Ilumatobacteraceae bacterium]
MASAARGYSYLQLDGERVLVNFSLAELEERLGQSFVRVHRSHLVNVDKIRELRPGFSGGVDVVMNDRAATQVSVARRQASELRRRLGL